MDRDPLTEHLGRSATTVGRLEFQSQPEKLKQSGSASDRRAVQQANKLMELLVAGDVTKVPKGQLDQLIAHPNDMYRGADAVHGRIQGWIRELGDAQIAEREFANSSQSTQHFLRDYDTFIGYARATYQEVDASLQRGRVLKAPILQFMRSARSAVAAGDGPAYEAARDRYVRTLRSLGDQIAGPKATASVTEAQTALIVRLINCAKTPTAPMTSVDSSKRS